MKDFHRMIYRAPRRGFAWLYPTTMARATAHQLQSEVRQAEYDQPPVADWEVDRATVHGRQDIVLLVAWAEAHHRQLVTISRGVWIMGFLILVALSSLADRLHG
jgi:hypothetical protein